MSEPTLTIAVVCPTCGGSRTMTNLNVYGDILDAEPCPDCNDGTIRQAVSCASGCIRWGKPNDCPAYKPGDEKNAPMPDFGCTAWTAKDGA